jgi:hypothetical protein
MENALQITLATRFATIIFPLTTVAKWQNSGKLKLPLSTRCNSMGYKNSGKTVATPRQNRRTVATYSPPLKGGVATIVLVELLKM